MPHRVQHVHLDSPPELSALKVEALAAINRLRRHVPEPEPCPGDIPAYRRAAVLLGLFGGRHGDLHAVLSHRAVALRSHGGDTAIPGGRFEAKDKDLEATARREAWEETGLPIDSRRAIKLCELRPFLSANELVVTPIVVWLIDPLIQPKLNPSEVQSIFSVPLEAFLYHVPPTSLRSSLRLASTPQPDRYRPPSEVSGPSDWHNCRDISWLGCRVRRHNFWHRSNPIRGLTSDILIHCAMMAYDKTPSFSMTAPGQPTNDELIRKAFKGPLAVKKRRVRPRMSGLEQPVDDDNKEGTHRNSAGPRPLPALGATKHSKL
ncbi:hypothetical protein IE81DRAFT_347995 [Ceraceosorus guamensis]|uniref:Nudix hydrolase domain-containing protein n=1 Tax=Ceraceosorus guamensis TaxID=1522189 RepID=A0A316VVY2_9BASI|nr:hypothetical protein IE81DRAFT_347995 [Ceraceosorus guamensis]PWN41807.1 hypothetical protein IE81DRAFT_347995 [Ceraceosorus guamensis]